MENNTPVEQNKNIADFHEHSASKFLIDEHTIGDMRDYQDLHNAVYHARKTLAFAKDLILNIDGTNEQKAELLDRAMEDLTKFKIKQD